MNSAIINFYSQNKLAAASFDTDAQAFITAASITNTTQQKAINDFVYNLKDKNLWPKIFALYPIIGGNSNSHKYNLKDTTKFNLTFNGTWTHTSTGALGNNTNTYADVGASMSALGCGLNSYTIGAYNRLELNQSESADMGVQDGEIPRVNFYTDIFGTTTLFDAGASNSYGQRLSVASGGGQGFFIATRTSATNYAMYKNGATMSSTTSGSQSATSLPIRTFYFGAVNSSGTPVWPVANDFALWFIASGFNYTDVSNFTNAVQTYQTALGRNV